MSTSLTSLIEDVEARAATQAPLDRLAAAVSAVESMHDAADSLLSHFVDRSRRAGHSWSEIGAVLGVTKQAVQKRFTGERREPRGWERFTDAARRVVEEHAAAVSAELGHNYIGTEHLLAAMWNEPDGLAAKALGAAGMTRDGVVAAVDQRVPRGHQGLGGFTPRAWVAVENGARVALDMGQDHVGTEHLLVSLMSGVGGFADEILHEAGVTISDVRSFVGKALRR